MSQNRVADDILLCFFKLPDYRMRRVRPVANYKLRVRWPKLALPSHNNPVASQTNHGPGRHCIGRYQYIYGIVLAANIAHNCLRGFRQTARRMQNQQESFLRIVTVNSGHISVYIFHVYRSKKPGNMRFLKETGCIIENISIVYFYNSIY